MSEAGTRDEALAEKLAFSFVSIANDGQKLEDFSRYLIQHGWRRAAAVVDERFRGN